MAVRLSLIAALDRRGAIGRAGRLPWRLPEDLRAFKRLTLGKPVLMGHATAISIGRALPGRRNLVLSRRCPEPPYPGQQHIASLAQALAACADEDELMVIGGAQVYALCLPQAERLFLSEVATEVAGADAFFPAWRRGEWQALSRHYQPVDAHHAHAFELVEYRRRVVPKA